MYVFINLFYNLKKMYYTTENKYAESDTSWEKEGFDECILNLCKL